MSDAPPIAPEIEDDAFSVDPLPAWSLIENDLTPGDASVSLRVVAPAEVVVIDAFVDGVGHRLVAQDDGAFAGDVDTADLAAGEIEVLFSADGSATAFARRTFTRTHPLYVLVGTDWDDADNPAETYVHQEELHALYPGLKITHFLGPYTFTDPAVTEERRDFIVEWLQDLEAAHGDEVGVHIHPYCNFVETTDVACRTTPSVVYANGDATGYTVSSAAYTEAEYTTLLLAADTLFEMHGLQKPVSYRAGAWTADASTLAALENAGYLVDSDAFNWARMEEWIGVGNGGFYDYVSTTWAAIDDVSQPYFPARAQIDGPGDESFDLLEIPLNGVMADYVTGAEMIEIVGKNWPGGALSDPVVVAIGYHPPNYQAGYHSRMTEALDHLAGFRAADDAGPVVYATFAELTLVWSKD